jgi:hypothetical protein
MKSLTGYYYIPASAQIFPKHELQNMSQDRRIIREERGKYSGNGWVVCNGET